jgi:2-oxoglutarate/2-oxoacid ferredoxin oxidoreductase subunit alpha
MHDKPKGKMVLTDGSRLIIEALARAGADAFIGYPITPANHLYSYAGQRMELMLPAPDEITTLQWMCGLAVDGHLPVTATSFPGFALMLESVNMAFMMELPMVIVLVQRLGPATGTATCGAQGDLLLLKGMISGGHQMPVLSTSSFEDCWSLAGKAAHLAVELRTPVVLLTSKEEVMTQKSFDPTLLAPIEPVKRESYNLDCSYKPYKAGENLVPDFLAVTQNVHQVRVNASTHDQAGILQHSNAESMANTMRLEHKALKNLESYLIYDYDEQAGAESLIVAYGITTASARQAVGKMRHDGKKVSLLIPKTILPISDRYLNIIEKYSKVVIAEENVNAQFADLLFGASIPAHIRKVGALGKMISPEEIIKEEECA